MNTTRHLALAALALAVSGCPDDPEAKNPPRLWLALHGTETMVRLVPQEPEPY